MNANITLRAPQGIRDPQCSSSGCKRPRSQANESGKCCSACNVKDRHSGACEARTERLLGTAG